MNLKIVSKYILIISGILTFFFLYLFFRATFDFWLSDIVAIAPAVGSAYLITISLLRSKMSGFHKIVAAIVIPVTIGALVVKLTMLQVVVNKLQLIVN